MDTEKNSIQTHEQAENSQRYLHRSASNTIIGGVAGGLGEYFAIDPTVVRLGFILLAFVNGLGLLLYLVLWVIMPAGNSQGGGISQDQMQKNFEDISKTVSSQVNKLQSEGAQSWWGWLLVGLGVFFIVINFGVLDLLQLHVYWPILLILLGLVVISRR